MALTPSHRTILRGSLAAFYAALPLAAAQASTGARVLLQAWNPLTPDAGDVITLVDEPALVSDSLAEAWVEAHPKICDEIKKSMAPMRPGRQQLRDVTCILGEPTLKVTGGNEALRATFEVSGHLEATTTTPTILGSDFDPRISIGVKTKLDVVIVVQREPNQPLHVSRALFTLSDATIDSHNATADIGKFLLDEFVPFFGGPNVRHMVENAVNGLSFQLAGRFNTALAPVNAKLRGPSDAVRIGVSANADYVTVAFGPREFTPPANGRMTGTLRWNASQFVPRNGCQSFGITATVQTGPVPLLTANAEAPKRRVGQFQASPTGPDSCSFTMTGLAAGWPNVVTARVTDEAGARGAGNALYSMSYSLVGDGWDGRNVVPQPVASNRNYAVSRSLDADASEVADFSSPVRVAQARTNPRINPADTYATRVRRGTDVTLNPQPLPPVPDDDRAPSSDIIGARSNNAGIIIVSGQDGPGGGQRIRSARGEDASALADEGAAVVNDDPAASSLRDGQPTDAARRGFDIGVAVAKDQTLPGPGKDRAGQGLPVAEQPGFRAGLDYALERNRERLRDRAPHGAALADRDPASSALRDEQPDGAAQLGFDIGMAVAEGHTEHGPGKQGVRDTLALPEFGGAAAQRGFDAAVAFSIARNRNLNRAPRSEAPR